MKRMIKASTKSGPTQKVWDIIEAMKQERFGQDEILEAVMYMIPSEDVLRSLVEYGHQTGFDFTDLAR